MNNYDKYVYLSITEIGVETFKETNYVTYTEYCKGMYKVLIEGKLSKRDHRHIIRISEELESIFSMGITVTGQTIVNYFAESTEVHQMFEKSVIMTKKVFKPTGEPTNRLVEP